MLDRLRTPAARDGLIVLFAQGTSALIALGIESYLFRALQKNQQGVLQTGLTISALLLQASDLGLALTTIRLGAKHIAEGRPDLAAQVFRKTLRARLYCCTALFALTVTFAAPIAHAYGFVEPDGIALVSAAALGIFGNALVWWGVDVSQARRGFGAYAFQQIAAAILRAAALFAGLIWFMRTSDSTTTPMYILYALAAANLLSGALSLAIEFRSTRVSSTPIEPKNSPASFSLHFGAFNAAISILTALSTNADVFIVKYFLGEEDTAVFACARRPALVLILLATACITVLLPRAAAITSREACAVYLRKAIPAAAALALVTAGTLALAARIVIPIFGGQLYNDAIPILMWLCLAYGIQIAMTPLLLAHYPLKREAPLVAIQALGLIALAAFGALWTPKAGLEGAAWAVTASRVIMFVAAAFSITLALRTAATKENLA